MEMIIKTIFGLVCFFVCAIINEQKGVSNYWKTLIAFNVGFWLHVFLNNF